MKQKTLSLGIAISSFAISFYLKRNLHTWMGDNKHVSDILLECSHYFFKFISVYFLLYFFFNAVKVNPKKVILWFGLVSMIIALYPFRFEQQPAIEFFRVLSIMVAMLVAWFISRLNFWKS